MPNFGSDTSTNVKPPESFRPFQINHARPQRVANDCWVFEIFGRLANSAKTRFGWKLRSVMANELAFSSSITRCRLEQPLAEQFHARISSSIEIV